MTEYINVKTDERMNLDELIKGEIEILCLDFIEEHKYQPSKPLIRSWMDRLKRAHQKLEITEITNANNNN